MKTLIESEEQHYVPIMNFPTYYINAVGLVVKFEQEKIDAGVFNFCEIRLEQKVNEEGYAIVQMERDGLRGWYYVHELVAENFYLDEYVKYGVVVHKDGDKTNNDFNNLERICGLEAKKRLAVT